MRSKIVSLTNDQVLNLTIDARVVAFRWDVIPWCLVLDLDVPVADGDRTSMKRAWIIFSGIASITWSLLDARLPTGVWLTSAIWSLSAKNGLFDYHVHALLSQLNDDDTVKERTAQKVIIRAQGVRAVISKNSAKAELFGLAWSDRASLVTDQEFIDLLRTE
jgi:hypothetical protein